MTIDKKVQPYQVSKQKTGWSRYRRGLRQKRGIKSNKKGSSAGRKAGSIEMSHIRRSRINIKLSRDRGGEKKKKKKKKEAKKTTPVINYRRDERSETVEIK